MSSNIHQIFLANPTTTFVANDLMYLGRSPYAATDDFAFTYSSLIPVNTKGDLFTWSTLAIRLAVGANGTFLTPDSATATGLKWSTATLPATTTINQILYSSAANTVSGLATANDGVLITGATGIPSISSTLPSAVQGNITATGTIASGTWQGTAIGPTYGGTGLNSYITGDTIYASGTNVLTKLAGNTTTTKMYLSQTGDGVNSAAPAWAAVDGADITGAALTKVDDTNVTLTLGGTPTTALLRAASITAGWTGTLAVSRGGTGTGTAFTAGSVVFAGPSGVYSQDNASLFWDDSNNRLGIGTSSPTTHLTVNGNIHLLDTVATYPAGLATTGSSTNLYLGINASVIGTQTLAVVGGAINLTTSSNNVINFQARSAGSASLFTAGSIRVGASFLAGWDSLATTSTDGWFYMASVNGTPTGVPSANAGYSAFAFDRANNIFYVYNGGWNNIVGAGSTGITTLGTITTGTWNATAIGPTYGGTGQTTYTLGDILYSSASNTLSKLAGNTTTAKQFLAQTGTGVISAAPSWANIDGNDVLGAALTKVDDTNVTLTLGGTPTTALLRATSITAGWTGTLGVTRGGTGTGTTFTTGSVIFAGASGVYSQDNSNFFWDDTNNRLGIGTASPGNTLHVSNTAGGTIAKIAGNLSNIGFNVDLDSADKTALLYSNGARGLVIDKSTDSIQLWSPTALALTVTGDDVAIVGTLSKGSGTFTIDHPLDPLNKILQHSFVESPDMMNVYNGNVVCDEFGSANITLPTYFEALNIDFKYQLACVGGYSPVYVSSEIANNQFSISGGLPGQKVSWQVTGIRNDVFAQKNRIQVEIDKSDLPNSKYPKGKYRHPNCYVME